MAYGSGFGLLLSQTSQKRKMSYMGNELYLHLKTGNLQVGSRAPDMSMCFQHLRLTLTDLQSRKKRNLKHPNPQMSMNRAHLTSSPFNIQCSKGRNDIEENTLRTKNLANERGMF
ncbi:hypothetical protein HanRHA438_Chr10g0444651 [Helianthus annuus]|nr:hypothetical protein HanRHA438_Chr10g0444651 [Helianthus annuus]